MLSIPCTSANTYHCFSIFITLFHHKLVIPNVNEKYHIVLTTKVFSLNSLSDIPDLNKHIALN